MLINLLAEMKKQGKTQKHFAELLGVSRVTISNKIKGITPFTLKEAVVIANDLNVSEGYEYLFKQDANSKVD